MVFLFFVVLAEGKCCHCHCVRRVCVCNMLAFDIETTGLDPRKCVVTCVCVQDFHSGQKYNFEFAKVRHESPEQLEALAIELWKLLEAAPSLCAFNGIRFDTPFLGVALGLDAATVRRWNGKTSDILEHCREVYRHTFSLNLLCEANGIAVKTGDGLQAIHLAREHRWAELREYCEHDVHILCELYRKRLLTNPRHGRVMDLADFAAKYVYAGHKPEQNEQKRQKTQKAPTEDAPRAPMEGAKAPTEHAPDLWMQTVASRVGRLPCALVPAADVFGVDSKFCVARCPTCDAEGFIQEDTQRLCMWDGHGDETAVYACGMQHAYRIALRE